MTSIQKACACALAGLLLSACSTTYKPAAVDPKTGLYNTMASVDAGGVNVNRAPVNLDDFSAVLLLSESNTYPSRLEFVMRKTLSELGFRRVVNVAEFRQWAADSKFELPSEGMNFDILKKFSATVKPILLIDIRYASVGGPRHFADLRVLDGRNGTVLLAVDHPKTVWVSVDDEVIYPVLNELRKWRAGVGKQNA